MPSPDDEKAALKKLQELAKQLDAARESQRSASSDLADAKERATKLIVTSTGTTSTKRRKK